MTNVQPNKPVVPPPAAFQPHPPSATKTAPSLSEAARGDYLTLTEPPQRGPAVAAMQDALRAKGFEIKDEGGVLGASTSKAISDFQRAEQAKDPSFKVDGLAGPQTLGALGLAPKVVDVPRTGPASAPAYGAPKPEGSVKAGDLARADSTRLQTQPKGGTTMVPVEKTRMKGSEAADALSQAWTKKYGTPPSKETLSILTAQWALETGRGESMCNYNFGGIKGTSPESGLSASYKTKEGWGANEISITDRFRAYKTPEEGATDYLNLLDRRYGNALDAARAGDPTGFVHGLKQRGYFTGNEEVYAKNVTALSRSALDKGFDSIGPKG